MLTSDTVLVFQNDAARLHQIGELRVAPGGSAAVPVSEIGAYLNAIRYFLSVPLKGREIQVQLQNAEGTRTIKDFSTFMAAVGVVQEAPATPTPAPQVQANPFIAPVSAEAQAAYEARMQSAALSPSMPDAPVFDAPPPAAPTSQGDSRPQRKAAPKPPGV